MTQPFDLTTIVELAETGSHRTANEYLERGYRYLGFFQQAREIPTKKPEGVQGYSGWVVLRQGIYVLGRTAEVAHYERARPENGGPK